MELELYKNFKKALQFKIEGYYQGRYDISSAQMYGYGIAQGLLLSGKVSEKDFAWLLAKIDEIVSCSIHNKYNNVID